MVKARSPKAFFRWAAALAAVAVVMIGASAGEPRPVVRIPAGAPATLDGSSRQGEWDDALAIALGDAVTLYMKHADGCCSSRQKDGQEAALESPRGGGSLTGAKPSAWTHHQGRAFVLKCLQAVRTGPLRDGPSGKEGKRSVSRGFHRQRA